MHRTHWGLGPGTGYSGGAALFLVKKGCERDINSQVLCKLILK